MSYTPYTSRNPLIPAGRQLKQSTLTFASIRSSTPVSLPLNHALDDDPISDIDTSNLEPRQSSILNSSDRMDNLMNTSIDPIQCSTDNGTIMMSDSLDDDMASEALAGVSQATGRESTNDDTPHQPETKDGGQLGEPTLKTNTECESESDENCIQRKIRLAKVKKLQEKFRIKK